MSYIPRRRQITSSLCRGDNGVQTAPATCPEPRSSEQSQSSHLGPEPAPFLTCRGQVFRHRPGRAPSSEKHRQLALLEDASGLSPSFTQVSKTLLLWTPTDRQAVCSDCLAESSWYLGHGDPFSLKQLSSQNGGGAVGPERQLSAAGFVTRANRGSVTPAFSDSRIGMPRSAERRRLLQSRLYKVGQAWVSVKGASFQKFPKRRHVETSMS